MPIYEYECKACGHTFEEWQKMSDKPVRVCPKCKARKVEKLISHTSFQLKGGGWYSDLYASQKPAAAATTPSESGTDKPAAATATGSSGDKPAAKASGDSSGSTGSTPKPTEGKGNGKGKKGASKAAA